MIATLTGQVQSIGSSAVILDVGGVGFFLSCTPRTTAKLRVGEEVQLKTSLVVREESLTLYGFLDDTEKETFELAQSASGIGPKTALAILSVFTPAELVSAIQAEDHKSLTKVPGIGTKGAQKLVLELKDKVAKLGIEQEPANDTNVQSELWYEQVVSGLVYLGWSTKEAQSAAESVRPMVAADPQISVSQLISAALRGMAKQ